MHQPRLRHVDCLDPTGLHRMAYWEWGDAHNPRVVVCVHGLTRQGRDFDRLAHALAGDFRVVCPDVVGRGESDRLRDPMGYAVPTYVADMVTLLARIDAQELSWVGTSMGGLIGLVLAAQAGNPIGRLVLNDVGPTIEPVAMTRLATNVGKGERWASFDEAADAIWQLSQGFGPHSREDWLALTRPHVEQVDGGLWASRYDPAIALPLRAITPEIAKGGEAVLWRAYDAIRCPTLLLRGAQSDLLSAATAQAMTQRGPRAALVEFEGVGHAPTLIARDQIAAVRHFLTEPLAAA